MTKYTVTPNGIGSSLTPSEAMKIAKAGDVFDFNGTFRSTVYANQDKIYFENDDAVFDFNDVNKPAILVRGDDTTIHGGEYREGGGLVARDVKGLTIDDVYSHHNVNNGIGAFLVDDMTIKNSDISYNKGAAGITYHPKDHHTGTKGHHIIIENNDIYNNVQVGKTAESIGVLCDNNPKLDYTYSTLIYDNDIHDNGRVGVFVFNLTVYLRSNDIYDNGIDTSINPAWRSEVMSRNSNIYGVGNTIDSGSSGHAIKIVGYDNNNWYLWKYNTINGDYTSNNPNYTPTLDRTNIVYDHEAPAWQEAPHLDWW